VATVGKNQVFSDGFDGFDDGFLWILMPLFIGAEFDLDKWT
jgi:hypothetical protein